MYLVTYLLICFAEQGKGANSGIPMDSVEWRQTLRGRSSWQKTCLELLKPGKSSWLHGLCHWGLEKSPPDVMAMAEAAPTGLSVTHNTQRWSCSTCSRREEEEVWLPASRTPCGAHRHLLGTSDLCRTDFDKHSPCGAL